MIAALEPAAAARAKGKILVVRGGAIGDFILTLPVLAALREHFPDTHLEVLGYPRVTPLAVAGGLVDQARSIEARPLASFFARNGVLPESLTEYFASFALIISYLYDPDQIFRENIARCTQAQFILGPHRPDEQARVHAADALLRPLERLAIFDADATPRLRLKNQPPLDRVEPSIPPLDPVATSGEKTSAAWLALHPGSGSERKNWPEARWANLLASLVSETRLRFLLVGGEAEGERLRRLAAALPENRHRVAFNLPLAGLAELMQTAAGFIGHDSGISHLAAALGLPGLVLWGATRREIWRPRSVRFRLAESPAGLPELTVEQVSAELRALGLF